MAALSIPIPDDQIDSAVMAAAKKLHLVPEQDKRARKISLEEFRKDYCMNHSKTWVRCIIFDRFPETRYQNGGWAINPSGHEPGIRGTWIKLDQATKWLDKHDNEINWHEQLAKD